MTKPATYKVFIAGGNINTGFIYGLEIDGRISLDRFHDRRQAYAEAISRGCVPVDEEVAARAAKMGF